VLWAVIGAGVGGVIGVVRPEAWGWAHPLVEWAIGMGLYGVVSGIGFGAFVLLRERRRTLGELSHRRATAWGVLGAVAVPLLFGALGTFEVGTTVVDVFQAVLLTGVLGGTFAPASIAMARRADLPAGRASRLLGSAEE
jgi:hypothetical protein